MNDDEKLEHELRMLRPGPLPEDLKTRLSQEPPTSGEPKKGRTVSWSFLTIAAAACLVAMIAILMNRSNPGEDQLAHNDAPHVSVLQSDSTLLNSRPLALREHDGQVWEISEEEWVDDIVALCSATPVRVRSTESRKEIVCRPVEFQ